MTPLDSWKIVRQLIMNAIKVPVVEPYDERKGKDRPTGIYATLSLKKITPVAMPYTVRNRVGDKLESKVIIPSELWFEFTGRRGYSMDVNYVAHALNHLESCRAMLIKNNMSVWGVKDMIRDPEKVNQGYEDAVTPMLVIAAPLTTTELIDYADNVSFRVNLENIMGIDNMKKVVVAPTSGNLDSIWLLKPVVDDNGIQTGDFIPIESSIESYIPDTPTDDDYAIVSVKALLDLYGNAKIRGDMSVHGKSQFAKELYLGDVNNEADTPIYSYRKNKLHDDQDPTSKSWGGAVFGVYEDGEYAIFGYQDSLGNFNGLYINENGFHVKDKDGNIVPFPLTTK